MSTNGNENGYVKARPKESPSGKLGMEGVKKYAPRIAEKTVDMLKSHGFFLSETKNGRGVKCAATLCAIYDFSEVCGYGLDGKLLDDSLTVIADAGWKVERTPFNTALISAIAGLLIWIARSESSATEMNLRPVSAHRLRQVSEVLSPAGSKDRFLKLANKMGQGRNEPERRWDFLCSSCFKTPPRIVMPQRPQAEDAASTSIVQVAESDDSVERFYLERMGKVRR